MNKVVMAMIPCERCGENYSMLRSFVDGDKMQEVLDLYSNVCKECLTETETSSILKAAILQAQHEHLKELARYSGGTGGGFYLEKYKKLERYLKQN